MGDKKLVVTIGKDGKTTVEAVGYVGTSCKDATKALTEAIGQVKAYTDKPEMYQNVLAGFEESYVTQ